MSFSVVIPARNREALVRRAVASALRQTLPPLQVVVADDGSTDRTVAAAEAAGAVVVESTVSTGSGPARNRGVEATTGDWVAFLDSDDEWDADHLATLAGFTDGHVLVSSAARTQSGAVRGWRGDDPLELTPRLVFSALNQVATSGTAVRRAALLEAGGFRALPRAQDFDCWLRVLEVGPGIVTGRRTVLYHEHPGQVSRSGDLNRQCVLQIIGEAARRPWSDPQLVADTYARFFVDDLRTGVRNRQLARVTASVTGLARRPASWGSLLRLGRTSARRRIPARNGSAQP